MQIIFFKKQFKIVYIIYIKIKHLDEMFFKCSMCTNYNWYEVNIYQKK